MGRYSTDGQGSHTKPTLVKKRKRKQMKKEVVAAILGQLSTTHGRADKVSILLMMQAFDHFSSVSGLKANLEKSLFYVARVTQEFKAKIMQDMHFTIGEMSFKYLGIPLSSRKLSIHQCLPLVEKIITRVQCWTTKFLSYSGRVQLIKSVLFEMQRYWAQVFLLPKKILTMVTMYAGISCGLGVMNTQEEP
ncbi:PREDICTED: uncharacterized protein LOC109234848 [Nicotiana attenuata]|uniref:uncharacterized protein LOC109234848 n=1 Tax=Nicotiana attenuata TaxID=49451 RepID=UPI0009047475|nr:PREDICTED: uncharacterized protein LOC109234848 [Nicotiana attenuata]